MEPRYARKIIKLASLGVLKNLTRIIREDVDMKLGITQPEKWPEDKEFEPAGITMEEAREAMKRM